MIRSTKSAFTLLEGMIFAAVIATILAILIPSFTVAAKKQALTTYEFVQLDANGKPYKIKQLKKYEFKSGGAIVCTDMEGKVMIYNGPFIIETIVQAESPVSK